MSDYDDKSYYEIQLEQKQLVLILLLMVAVCVMFFFLGVYYVKGREPASAMAGPRGTAPSTPHLTAPAGPDKVETEEVSRFFEANDGRASAPKEGAEGTVVAESRTDDPPPKPRTPPPSPKPEPTKPAPVPSGSSDGRFIVQIAAVKDVDRANQVRNELVSKGFQAYVETQDAGGEKLYKVRVGPFSERDEADRAKEGLRGAGYGGAFVSTN